MKRIMQFGTAVLFAAIGFDVFAFQGNSQDEVPRYVYTNVNILIPADLNKGVKEHEARTAKLVNLFKKETLDETFVGLLDDQAILPQPPHRASSIIFARRYSSRERNDRFVCHLL